MKRIATRVLVLDAAVKTMVGLDDPATLRERSGNPWVRQFFSREPSQLQTEGAGSTISQTHQPSRGVV